jgi:hypothetical protein
MTAKQKCLKMHQIKISLLEEFRQLREDEFDQCDLFIPNRPDVKSLIAKIKGVYKPVNNIMSIDGLIHSFLKDGTTSNESFALMQKEIEQLQEISKEFEIWQSNVPFKCNLSPDIVLNDKIDKLRGMEGSELRIGMEFIDINLYDNSIFWKAYCVALQLTKFNLLVISYTEFRPYIFTLSKYEFYPYAQLKNEVIAECNAFIEWCRLNKIDNHFKI